MKTIFALCAASLTLGEVLAPALPAQQPGGLDSVARSTSQVANELTDDPFFTMDRIDWPGPNAYRDATGAPGPQYWQQRADYAITAALDTGARTVTGTVRVTYTNNSPDTLRFVWMQLDQNLFRAGSEGSALYPADSRFGARNFRGGYTLKDVTVNGVHVTPKIDDTMMRLDLPTPLPARGGKTVIVIQYAFMVPDHGADRMGHDSALFEIAQWYPRMAVYDDVRGWNADQYLGQGEFYLEYGDIAYSVTVPAGYTVAGSGVLQNPKEVLTETERGRLARAAQSTTTVVPIITDGEAAAGRANPQAGTKTWKFLAHSVRDVAWAAAPDFRWDAVNTGPISGNDEGVLCQAYYEEPKSGKSWEAAAEQTQYTIRQYSTLFFPFPYPQATSVSGPVGGMEYPMFVMVHYGKEDPESIFGTVNHEHGHEWFPMIVGSNERRYAWMDEGFNTYINTFSNDARYPGKHGWAFYLNDWRNAVTKHIQRPLMSMPDHIDPDALHAVGYRKPAIALLTLRDAVLGRETFDRAFREYIRRWAFKHPTPGDFFRTMENVSGRDLSWFWRGFFYGSDVLDIGIDNVSSTDSAATITLHRHTSVVFPVTMRLALSDGTTQDVTLPVDIWGGTNPRFEATVATKSRVVGVRLWANVFVPDWNPSNDTWGSAPPPDSALAGSATRM